MNGNAIQFSDWKAVLTHKAHILHSQIAYIQSGLRDSGASDNTIATISEPYYALLENLFTEDYPLVHAMEASDLVVRLKGAGVDSHSPRVSIITSYFNKVRKQVTNIAKAISNLEEQDRRIPKEFDLTVTAFARGSLVLGFSLPTLQDLELDGFPRLFGENEPLFLAAREAMKTLGVVSHIVTKDASLQTMAEIVPDAKLRDVTLSALKELSPSGRQGISSVALAGKHIGDFDDGILTSATRKEVRNALEQPVMSEEEGIFYGMVREIDLDAHRFELRHIENEEINSLRCKYRSYSDIEAKRWLNQYVRVSGIVERDDKGRARLMDIYEIVPDQSSSS